MGLNDLLVEIKQDPNSFLGDESMENKVLRQVLALVEDKISEVKNQAVKWCAYTTLYIRAHNTNSKLPVAWVSSSRSFARVKWSSSSTS